MPMQCQEEHLPGQILQKHVMQSMLSTDAMSKSRHQQLLQSLPVNFCGPMVYSNKLLDIGGSWFQPHCDFDWFSTSTCDMASVSAIWVRSNVFQGRCLPKAAVGYLAHGIALTVSMSVYLLEFSLILPFPISPGTSMDFRRFPGARQRLAMLSFRTQIKQRALLVEFNGDCALKVWVYKFIWVITCFNVFINPL